MRKNYVPFIMLAIALLYTIPKTDAVSVVNRLAQEIIGYQMEYKNAAARIAAIDTNMSAMSTEKKILQAKLEALHQMAEAARHKQCETDVRACSWDIFVTSYNPLPEQTDASPCIGASGVDLCHYSKHEQIIAVSRELYARLPNGTRVRLVSDIPQCNGIFVVRDTMAKRWKMRGDLFFMRREMNTSCNAKMTVSSVM